MIDKARAAQAATLGNYYRYPCPIDVACLAVLRIVADTFREAANRAVVDQAVDELLKLGGSTDPLLSFDPVQLNA